MINPALVDECGEMGPIAKDKADRFGRGRGFQNVYNKSHFGEDSSVLNDIASSPHVDSAPWSHRDEIIEVLSK